MPEPGWVRDPSGRYHQRYFDGSDGPSTSPTSTAAAGSTRSRRSTAMRPAPPGRRPLGRRTGASGRGPAASRPGGARARVSPRRRRPLVGLARLGRRPRRIVAHAAWYRESRVAQLGSPVGGGCRRRRAGGQLLRVGLGRDPDRRVPRRCDVRRVGCRGRSGGVGPGGHLHGVGRRRAPSRSRADLPGLSLGYGFFVALVGLVATTTAPLLPAAPGASLTAMTGPDRRACLGWRCAACSDHGRRGRSPPVRLSPGLARGPVPRAPPDGVGRRAIRPADPLDHANPFVTFGPRHGVVGVRRDPRDDRGGSRRARRGGRRRVPADAAAASPPRAVRLATPLRRRRRVR